MKLKKNMSKPELLAFFLLIKDNWGQCIVEGKKYSTTKVKEKEHYSVYPWCKENNCPLITYRSLVYKTKFKGCNTESSLKIAEKYIEDAGVEDLLDAKLIMRGVDD